MNEIRVPLDTFQQDFIVTHCKDKAKALLSELHMRANQCSQPFAQVLNEWVASKYEQTSYWDDNWYFTEIPLERCYFAHTSFHGTYQVPKDKRFVDFLESTGGGEIENDSFPCSAEIKNHWGPMPPVMIEERDPNDSTKRVTDANASSAYVGCERYYILDGQLRVVRHWYHSHPIISAYIYRGDGKV